MNGLGYGIKFNIDLTLLRVAFSIKGAATVAENNQKERFCSERTLQQKKRSFIIQGIFF